MKSFKKSILTFLTALTFLMPLSACDCATFDDGSSSSSSSTNNSSSVNNTVSAINPDEMFTDRDNDASYSSSSPAIVFNGANVTSDSASCSGGVATISSAGTYIVSGTGTNGQIVINASTADKIQLVLNGLNLTNTNSAPIYVKQADKVFITIISNNTLTSTMSTAFTDGATSVDGTIFSKDDLTFNGTGTLNVIAQNFGHGIVSKDDIAITDSTLNINAKKSGISANNSVRIGGGNITINATTDGVHAENTEDTSLGFIYMDDGIVNVTSTSDGFEASSQIQIQGGSVTISASGKGIKATNNVLISNGTVNATATDDALHSNSDILISNGTITLKSNDDGIHADTLLQITGGTINVVNALEGIEGCYIEITGGNVTVNSSDDGLNAGGGDGSGSNDPFTPRAATVSTTSPYVKISGGTLNVTASGDGLDSNGNLYVSGGKTYVLQKGAGNGAIDVGDNGCFAQVDGGELIACGDSGMAVNFSQGTQGSIMYNATANGAITLKNSSGTLIAGTFTPSSSYSSVVITCPGLTQNSTYTLTLGSSSYNVTLSSLFFSNSNGGGTAPGGRH